MRKEGCLLLFLRKEAMKSESSLLKSLKPSPSLASGLSLGPSLGGVKGGRGLYLCAGGGEGESGDLGTFTQPSPPSHPLP